MNDQQGQMMNMPLPMIMMGHPGMRQDRNEVPARVRMALAFLDHMVIKRITRVAVNDISIEEIQPPRLTVEEETAQGAACDLLTQYFNGKLKHDKWEQTDLELRSKPEMETDVTMMNCFGCGGSGSPQCRICKGAGKVVVKPVVKE